jgi:hypothetical protein
MSLIKIKRTDGTAAPSTIVAGELAYSYAAGAQNNLGGKLLFGTGVGPNTEYQIIGGKYFTDFLDHVPGTLTASSALLVDSNSKVDNFKVDNLDFDANTVSSTDTDGAVVLNPNGNGKVELDFANNAAAFARITGATASQYKDNITTAADANAIPNKQYVDDAISSTSSSATLYVSNLADPTSDPEQRTAVNLATENLNFVGTNDISVTVAKTGNDVTFTISSEFDLDQDVGTTDSVTFAAVTVDGITIDNNAITTTNGTNLTLTATGAEVIANSLTVSDLTATRVVFVGTNGALVDDANLTFTTASGKLDVTGELEVDNVSINGNTIGTVDTNGKLTLAPNGTGVVEIDSNALTTTETTFNLVNGTATTVNFAGAGTTVSIGAATGTTTINNANTVVTGDLAVNGGDLTTTATTFNLLNTTATTINFGGAATTMSIGAANTSTVTFGNDVVITGDLTVNGDTVTINTTSLEVEDPLIRLAVGNNSADSLDIGFVGSYGIGTETERYTGFFRDATNGQYYLFNGALTSALANNVIDRTTEGFALAKINADEFVGMIDGGTY